MHDFRLVAGLLVLLGVSPSAPAQGVARSIETKFFPAQPDDVLVVHNDYGRVRIRTWNDSQIRADIQKIALDESHLDNITIVSDKRNNRIFFQSYFYSYHSESAYIDIQLPKSVNIVVSGANPAVEVYGSEGFVRVHTTTGLITGKDLTSAVSLLSEQGDILFRTRLQPQRDIRLESVRGNVLCELDGGLNARGWLRAGGTLSWNREVEIEKGSLEKQIGTRGPLLLASSFEGDVELRLRKPSIQHTLDPLPAEPDTGAPPQSGQGTHPTRSPPPGDRQSPTTAKSSSPEVQTTASDDDRQPTSSVASENAEIAQVPVPSRQGGTVEGGYALKVNVDWIYLNISVRDRYSNRSIPNLSQEDFLVYENDAPQRVEYFESTEAPFDLLLLLDVSGSTRSHMQMIKEASIDFTREIKSNDRIAVATFNSQTHLIQDFTNDRQQAASAIRRVRSGGGTAFYDAMETSIVDYMRGREGRKAIVVFTDGVDNQLTGDFGNGSRVTFDELFREIQEIDTIIYTIFLDTERYRPSRRRGRGGSVIDVLGDILRGGTPPIIPIPGTPRSRGAYEEARRQVQLIADQTGGRMYTPGRVEDLSHVYSEIADDLRIQYRLGYNSTNPSNDGTWRGISVKLRDQKDAVARTRRGYYARRGIS